MIRARLQQVEGIERPQCYLCYFFATLAKGRLAHASDNAWLLKTILGFFHAGVLSKDGRKIGKVQKIMNPAIDAAYCTGRLPEPCGMYVLKNGPALARRGVLDFVSLSDQPDERIIGCGLTIL